MGTLKQNLVEYSTIVAKSKGTSNSSNLRSMFPGSPIYKGDISDAERLEFYQNFLDLDNVDSDSLHTIAGYYGIANYSMNYVENNMPVMSDVEVGGAGKPSSPYTPNLTSPGPGSTDASNQPAYEGEIKDVNTISNFGSGLGGITDPISAAKNISTQKIGSFVSGRSFQGSDGKS
jgi:hypothetical protein